MENVSTGVLDKDKEHSTAASQSEAKLENPC